jgi:putative transposase
LARTAIEKFGLKHRRACRVFGLNRFVWWYKPQPDRNVKLRERMRELAAQYPYYGHQMIHDMIRAEWEVIVNHKRTERLYREEKLLLKLRKKKKRLQVVRQPLELPTGLDDVWSMDFIFDRFANDRQLKVLTMVDHYSRSLPDILPSNSIKGADVVRVLERLRLRGRKPKIIITDNGSEFRSRVMRQWVSDHNVEHRFIQPGKPTQNAFIESLNGRFRSECLDQNLFENLDAAGLFIRAWKREYETVRPHSSLGGIPPAEFLKRSSA